MGRIRNTIELAKVSWGVLNEDRELLVIPVISFLVSAAVIAALLVPAIALIDTSSTDTAGGEETTADPALAVIAIIAVLALSVVSVFFNGALVAGAHHRLTGGDPDLGGAIRKAFSHISGLVPWALLTATVGLVLQALRDRAGWLGRFIVDAVGIAWDVATFLVVPAIVVDDHGAWDGLKRSGALLRTTWGENLAARIGFGLLGFLAVIPAIALAAILGALGTGPLIVGIVIAGVWIALVVVVMTALNAVFQTALYLYATTGSLPAGFEGSTLANSFEPR